MERKDESLINLLTRLPWWMSVVLAVIAYPVFKVVIPSVLSGSQIFGGVFAVFISAVLAPCISIILLIAAGISSFSSCRRSAMLDSRTGIDSVRSLSWQEFEELVGEAYRRQGYFVIDNPGRGADGGVDLRLRKGGKKIYVQCKHWKAQKVNVHTVREFYGVMHAGNADQGIVVTCGTYTWDAMDFAKGKPIELINGRKLLALIGEVQKEPNISGKVAETQKCPKCGSEMISRTAKKGKNIGRQFWGCSNFPKCRSTLPY